VEAERNSDDALQPTSDVHAIPFHDHAILGGLDGWHLSRAPLEVFPEPQIAHDRRGSDRTVDGAGCVAFDFVCQLRDTSFITNGKIITPPSFDHALKDPIPNAVSIHPHHRIIIIEGLSCHPSTE
jgi:pantothenate kinase